MARPKRLTDAVKLTLTVSKRVAGHLEKLTATGFYGGSRAECAERLVCEQLRALIRDKVITVKKIDLDEQKD